MTFDSQSDDPGQRQLRQAAAALDRALRSGRAARAEEWLRSCPAVASDDDLAIELIYGEYVSRESMGETPSAQEYYDRFPAHASRLSRLFDVDALLAEGGAPSDATPAPGVDTLPQSPAAIAPARRIGPFELIEKLGGGGMGVVYRARQDRPSREVALKLLRAGADAHASELFRFRREAEAASRLQHPNIVTVYSVGEHEGQPYLAMELVTGGDLRSRLNGRPMSPGDAARLVQTLALAIAAAHEAGVVHRDLKPANVLMTEAGPKIADFGLAAVTDAEPGLTRSGQALGTLSYMAPEQAAGATGPARPAVDVYSLGAILYECLTGRPPFVADTESALLKLIAEADPVSPRRLAPHVPIDLETVALKCLAKAPERRYASATALAEDLGRFLSYRPVLARPAGPVERAMKWSRRHPVAVSLLGVGGVSLIAITVLAAVYTAHLKSALADAQRQRNAAEEQKAATRDALEAEARRRAQALAALERLTSQLVAGSFGRVRKPEEQLRQLELALKSYQEFAADDSVDPVSRLAAVDAHSQASKIQSGLGRDPDALATLNTAIGILDKLESDQPGHAGGRFRRASLLHDRGRLLLRMSRFAEAIADARASLVIQRSLPGHEQPAHRSRMAGTLMLVASSLQGAGQGDEARAVLRETTEMFERLVADTPTDRNYRNGLANCLHNRGIELEREGDPREAEKLYLRATELRVVDGKLPEAVEEKYDQARCHSLLGAIYRNRRDRAEAAHHYFRACLAYEELTDERPHVVAFAIGLASALSELAKLDTSSEDLDARFRRARQLLVQASQDPTAIETVIKLAAVTCNHGLWLNMRGRSVESLVALDAARAALSDALKSRPDSESARTFLTNTHIGRGNALTRLERHAEAVDAYADAVALAGEDRAPMFTLEQAKALARTGRVAEAIALTDTVDSAPVSLLVQRASVFAIAAKAATPDRDRHAEAALRWLAKARAAGQLRHQNQIAYLTSHGDWAFVRAQPEFASLVKIVD